MVASGLPHPCRSGPLSDRVGKMSRTLPLTLGRAGPGVPKCDAFGVEVFTPARAAPPLSLGLFERQRGISERPARDTMKIARQFTGSKLATDNWQLTTDSCAILPP